MGSFAEQRKKNRLTRETEDTTSFREERLKRVNLKEKSKTKMTEEPELRDENMYDHMQNMENLVRTYGNRAKEWTPSIEPKIEDVNVEPVRTPFSGFKEQMLIGKQNMEHNAAKRKRATLGQGTDEGFLRYDEIQSQPDYQKNVEAGRNRKNIFNSQPESLVDYLDKDVWINERVRANDSYAYMNETEKDLYSYLVGKYGAKSGADYIESIRPELNKRATEKIVSDKRTQAETNGDAALGDYVHSALTGYMRAPLAIGKQAYNNVFKGGEALDPNDPVFRSEQEKEALREGFKENTAVTKAVPDEGLRSFGVDTGLSMLDTVTRLPMGYLGLGAAAGSAAASGMQDALGRGGSGEQALLSGLASGTWEYAAEKAGFDRLKGLKLNPATSAREYIKNIAKQGATEGLEEAVTEIANTASDAVIMQELSQVNLDYENYLVLGMNEAEARAQAVKDMVSRVGLAAAGGAVSGGVMGTGAQTLGLGAQELYYRDTGRKVNPDYRDYAESIDVSEESYSNAADHEKAIRLQRLAQEYADRQKQGEFISNREKGKYETELDGFVYGLLDKQEETAQDTMMADPELEDTAEVQQESDAPVEMPGQQPEPDAHLEQVERQPEPDVYEPQEHAKSPDAEAFHPVAEESLSANEKGQNKADVEGENDNLTLAKAWSDVYGDEGKTAFEGMYDGEVSIQSYYKGFNQYYNAGRYGMDETVTGRSAAAALLSHEQRAAAYKAGLKDRELEKGYDVSTLEPLHLTKGEAKEGGLSYATESATEAQKKTADYIGKRTGLKIELVDEAESPEEIASYKRKSGVVRIRTDAKNFNSALSHELTHFIQDYSPDNYQSYQETVVQAIAEANGADLETMISKKIDQYRVNGQELSRAEAVDEIVANATESFLNDEEFVKKIIYKDRTLGEKIRDFLDDVIEAITSLIKTGSVRAEAKALEENARNLKRAKRMWEDGLDAASKRRKEGWESKTKAEREERYALKNPDQINNETLEQNYEYVRNMKPIVTLNGNEFEEKRGVKVLTEAVMEYYDSVGNEVHNDVVGDILLSRRSVKDDIAHGYNDIKAITFKAVPEVLEKGKVLQFNKDWKSRGYDTAVIGGKIKVADGKYAGDYYQICIVKVDANQNRMYLHEVQVIKTDGNIPFKTWTVNNNGLPSGHVPSIYSIFEKLTGVNTEDVRFQLKAPDQVTDEIIEKNYEHVKNMDSVITLKGDEFTDWSKKRLSEQVMEYYDSIGNETYNDVVGKVLLNQRSVKNDIAHGVGRLKAITFRAVPSVIKNGKVLSIEKDWKKRGYDSIAIGAKISIDGGVGPGDYFVICMLNVDKDNRLYLHEAKTVKMDDLRSKTRSAIAGGLSGANHPSIDSIFEKLARVNTEDVRFQLEEVEDNQQQMQQLIEENKELKAANELLKKQFEITSTEELRQSDIEKIAGKVLKDYTSTYDKKILTRNLTKLYEYVRTNEYADMNDVAEVASDIARGILKQSQQKDTALTEQYKDLRKQIREHKISLSDQDKEDLAAAGGYNQFRKKYFGKIKLGNDGIPVDSLYMELNDQYPELFDIEITHPADQLQVIANVIDMTEAQVHNPYHGNMDEMSYLVGQELLSAYGQIHHDPATFADKKQAELNRLKREHARELTNYKRKVDDEYKKIARIHKEEQRKLQSAHDIELLNQKYKFENRLKNQRESYERQNTKKHLIKEVKTLSKWLLEPTDAKHIPEYLRTVVAEFLNHIDYSSKENDSGIITQRTQAWMEASSAFQAIINQGGVITDDEGNAQFIDIDPDLHARFMELYEKVKGIEKIENLPLEDMQELFKIVISMKKALQEINYTKGNAKYGQISLLAEDVFRDTESAKNRTQYEGAAGALDKMVNYDMLDPQTMFGKVGPAFKTTYDALRNGLDKKTRLLKTAEDYFTEALEKTGITRKEIREWTGVNAAVKTFELSNGKKIELTIPQIMSLYELDKRGQARKHIYNKGRGIKADDRKVGLSLDNKRITLPKTIKGSTPIKVTESEVKHIVNSLTQQQKQLADTLQQFIGGQVADWGNEATMDMYGYKKFTAKNYFPIVTDKNYIDKKENANEQKATIKNLGMTKATNKQATSPILIEDIFDVFTRQVDQMSSYNAYVGPLSDLNKLMNYKDYRGFNNSTIKEQINRAFGKNGVDYIDRLIDDVNGSIRHDQSIGDLLVSNMKAASVAGNLRVAVQQPTAIARALAEMDAKYIAKGIAKPGKKNQWNLIVKYAPIAQWKDWGFYQMQTSRAMKDVLIGSDSAKQRLVNKSMFLAALGDKVSWERLWSACELETLDKHPTLQDGSEEYYEEVGRRFSEIIDKTQVVDSVLHRTQIMRNKDGMTKMATSFLGEPLKSWNMIYRAAYDVYRKKPRAGRKLERTIAAYITNAFFTAAAAAIIDAMRDGDREKEWNEKYKENLKTNLHDNLNLLNGIPWVKDALSIMGGYTPARTDLSGIQDLYYAWLKVQKYRQGDSKYTPQYVAANAIQAMSKATGIPIKNITRDVVSMIDTVINAIDGEADYQWLKQTYSISGNKKMYVEMMMQAQDTGDPKLAKTIRTDLIKSGISEEELQEITNRAVNDMIDERLDLDGTIANYNPSNKLSVAAFRNNANQYITLKKRAGWDEKKCLQQIRTKITEIYKPMYQEAKTQAERDRIVKLCKSFYYNGDSLYKDYDFRQWKEK